MNKIIDAMLTEISPSMLDQAVDLLSAVDKAITPSPLLPAKIRSKIPPLGAGQNEADPFAIVKFFQPDGNWTWFAFEFDGDDTFFGFAKGHEDELGYFSLRELQEARGRWGLPVERDLYFKPTRLSNLR